MSEINSSFFSKNADFYGAMNANVYDYYFLNFIENTASKPHIIDIGGGGGLFAGLCITRIQNSKVMIIDPSPALLSKNLPKGVIPIIGSLPNNISIPDKAEYIHLKEVLHHITDINEAQTKIRMMQSLNKINEILDCGGYLLLHEIYYESFFSQTLTRNIIFYILKLQNFFNLKIPSKKFIKGLDVLFLTRYEIEEMLIKCNFEIVEKKEFEWSLSKKYRYCFLLKKWGRICYIAMKKC